VPLWGFLRDALPLTLAAGLAVGAVVWLHGHRVTSRFEADGLLPGVLMLAVVSEFGPLAVGLIAATRLASGITAELGTMVATEQVDALRLLGVSPFRRLAQPRVIALVLALPPLTVAVDYAALAGGILGETLFGTLSPTGFLLRAAEPLEPVRVLLWSLKTPVFGIIAGLVACRHGLGCPPDAHAVGRAVTGSVMVATLGVLLADVALVVLIDGLLG
jgi:phospholipid/cholesterol/gamma-HCH transport system permease protein